MRAGAYALSLLSVPLNVHLLEALEERPMGFVDLRRAAGSPPEATMRKQLRALAEIGILERRQGAQLGAAADYELLRAGHGLAEVARTAGAWLRGSPEGPLQLGSAPAKSVVKALVEAWSSAIVRALAARPLSLADLSRLISSLSYPALQRRLSALRYAGLVEACSDEGQGRLYTVTPWLRAATAPLSVAARWEQERLPSPPAPIGRLDVDAAFLLVVPLMRLSERVSGACRLAVELRGAEKQEKPAGVLVGVESGRVVSCVSRLRGPADGSVYGTSGAWLAAVTEGTIDRLELGGERDLAAAFVEGLHGAFLGLRRGPYLTAIRAEARQATLR
jgi:DNA-binding HxlR family transcriptional regulator